MLSVFRKYPFCILYFQNRTFSPNFPNFYEKNLKNLFKTSINLFLNVHFGWWKFHFKFLRSRNFTITFHQSSIPPIFRLLKFKDSLKFLKLPEVPKYLFNFEEFHVFQQSQNPAKKSNFNPSSVNDFSIKTSKKNTKKIFDKIAAKKISGKFENHTRPFQRFDWTEILKQKQKSQEEMRHHSTNTKLMKNVKNKVHFISSNVWCLFSQFIF